MAIIVQKSKSLIKFSSSSSIVFIYLFFIASTTYGQAQQDRLLDNQVPSPPQQQVSQTVSDSTKQVDETSQANKLDETSQANETEDITESLTAPSPLGELQITYPKDAPQLKETISIQILLTIDEQGQVSKTELNQDSAFPIFDGSFKASCLRLC